MQAQHGGNVPKLLRNISLFHNRITQEGRDMVATIIRVAYALKVLRLRRSYFN
ncbi:MAG: hypothetical protein ACI9BO_000090 [Zhongshania sp.]|jgi:hypothetical protein